MQRCQAHYRWMKLMDLFFGDESGAASSDGEGRSGGATAAESVEQTWSEVAWLSQAGIDIACDRRPRGCTCFALYAACERRRELAVLRFCAPFTSAPEGHTQCAQPQPMTRGTYECN